VKFTAVHLLPLLAGVVVLQACSPKMASDSSGQKPGMALSPVFAQSVSAPPNERYLFLEIWIAFDGSGTLPMTRIDFPGYDYDADTEELRLYGRGIDSRAHDRGETKHWL
jgi:hypothetical protein